MIEAQNVRGSMTAVAGTLCTISLPGTSSFLLLWKEALGKPKSFPLNSATRVFTGESHYKVLRVKKA